MQQGLTANLQGLWISAYGKSETEDLASTHEPVGAEDRVMLV